MVKLVCQILLIILVLSSCSSDRRFKSNQRNSQNGVDSVVDLGVAYKLYHDSPDSSSLFFTLDSRTMLYTRASQSEPFCCKLKVDCELFDPKDRNQTIYRKTYLVEDVDSGRTAKRLTGHVKIPIQQGDWRLKITSTDVYRNSQRIHVLNASRNGKLQRQDLLFRNSEDKMLFNQFIPGGKMKIESKKYKGSVLKAACFNRNFAPAPPPFVSVTVLPFDHKPDTLLYVPIDKNGRGQLTLSPSGFTVLNVDTAMGTGLMLCNFQAGFPNFDSRDQLIDPLRYLCTKDEFKSLKDNPDHRAAFERFWIEKSSNKQRARTAIKYYFGRVVEANKRYTSYKEGWKTDRGMLQIILGEPTVRFRRDRTETWIYGDENNPFSMSYTFVKIPNRYSDNHFRLDRRSQYKTMWFQAVETWRAGRIYTFR